MSGWCSLAPLFMTGFGRVGGGHFFGIFLLCNVPCTSKSASCFIIRTYQSIILIIGLTFLGLSGRILTSIGYRDEFVLVTIQIVSIFSVDTNLFHVVVGRAEGGRRQQNNLKIVTSALRKYYYTQ